MTDLQKEVTPLYRLMAEGENSLFWKTIKEDIESRIALLNNIETVTVENLEIQKGRLRAYKDVLNIPEKLKERAKEG